MLLLQVAADASAPGAPAFVPVDETAATHLERALLSDEAATAQSELRSLFSLSPDLSSWALRTAENRLGRTVNRSSEAAEWLAMNLVSELATSLVRSPDNQPMHAAGSRLTALVSKLYQFERRAADFDARLEHEKLEALKELAYGASHEINNPLANIAARAQSLLDGEADAERRRKLIAIHRQAMRAHEMISDLMLFARPPRLNLVVCDLGTVTQTAADEFAEIAAEQQTALTYDRPSQTIAILGDETQLAVAIRAVIHNSLEAVGRGGHVLVSVRRDRDSDELAEICVRDDGPGIPDTVRQHMFDPFFSGREAGRGLGFGLSKCWRIVTDHGGRVVVRRSPGGAEISLLLPLSSQAE